MNDFERATCMTTKMRQARKSHDCCECGGVINKREHYQYVSGIWEGQPNSHKTCLLCVAARRQLEAMYKVDWPCDIIAYEYLWDSIFDGYNEDEIVNPELVAFIARARANSAKEASE